VQAGLQDLWTFLTHCSQIYQLKSVAMSDPKLPPKDVEKYASEFLASNLKWAQRMNQVFPQYFPDSSTKQEPKVGRFSVPCQLDNS
jgi:hypothetical protein